MSFRDKNLRFAQRHAIVPEVFSAPIVAIELQEEPARHHGNVAAFVLALNSLGRLFENTVVAFPQGTPLGANPWHLETVDEAVEEINLTVDGAVHTRSPRESDIVLSIGTPTTTAAKRSAFCCGTQWVAALDQALDPAGEGILGCLYGATLGAAQVLLHALDLAGASYKPMPPYCFNLLDYSSTPRGGPSLGSIDIPEAHLVGVGAVGSACLYALAHLPGLTGEIHLIDNEPVDEGNLNRYVLMRQSDLERPKVDVGTRALSGHGLAAVPHEMTYAQFARKHQKAVDLLLTPVDSEEGRCALAKELPRRVINAATGGTTITLSSHGFADGKACLHCLYLPKTNKRSRSEIVADDIGLSVAEVEERIASNAPLEPRLVASIESHRGVAPGTWATYSGKPILSFYDAAICGEAALRLPTDSVIAPLSFISCTAGILLAVELAKLGSRDLKPYALDNYLRLDTLQRPNSAFRRVMQQETTGMCICHDPDYVDTYTSKHSKQ